MGKLKFERCTRFDTLCRFCSKEMVVIPYSPLITDPRSKRLIAGAVEYRGESLGEWCNNLSQWCNTVNKCPAREGLAAYGCGIKADGCGVYAVIK